VRRGSIVRLTIYGVLAGIAASVVAVLVPWLPTSASEEMDRIEFTFWFATVICIGVFGVVAAVIVYSVLNFRSSPGSSSTRVRRRSCPGSSCCRSTRRSS
jgi:heme/copper-type cytochrome/quinol oxidase subunit 2